MDEVELRAVAAITDPIERAREASRVIAEKRATIAEAARLRRAAIAEARSAGMRQVDVGRALGVTRGRVSQIEHERLPVVTGWFLPASDTSPERRVALCGSRAAGTDSTVIDAAVPALAMLLLHCRCRVTNGPAGVGIEVLTYVADHYQPPGLGSITGVLGHANVVRDAEYVLLVGGGQGTQEEVDAAVEAGLNLLPMPTAGGTSRSAYALMQREASLRAWMPAEDFTALEHADADEFARIVGRLLTLKPGVST